VIKEEIANRTKNGTNTHSLFFAPTATKSEKGKMNPAIMRTAVKIT
jgi:hypothetical protein